MNIKIFSIILFFKTKSKIFFLFLNRRSVMTSFPEEKSGIVEDSHGKGLVWLVKAYLIGIIAPFWIIIFL